MEKTEFKTAELVDGPVDSRVTREFGSALDFINDVAVTGRERPAFTTIGWWKPGQGGDRSARVLVPRIFFDIDLEEDILEGRSIARDLCIDLHEWGFDIESTYVGFSGRKGWHVVTSAGAMGMPFFRNTAHARGALNEFFSPLVEKHGLDGSVYSPLSIIRLTGSTHGDTGNRKWTLPAKSFCRMEREVEAMVRRFAGDTRLPMDVVRESGALVSSFSDPFDVETNNDLALDFAEVWEDTESGADRRSGGSTPRHAGGDVVMTDTAWNAFQGLSEGEKFGKGLYGREYGAFVLACHWARKEMPAERILDLLRKWDRQRNDPPLQEDPMEESYVLEEKVNSAIRTTCDEGQREKAGERLRY